MDENRKRALELIEQWMKEEKEREEKLKREGNDGEPDSTAANDDK